MAAIQLYETIDRAFNLDTARTCIAAYRSDTHRSDTHYLEIPIKDYTFEIPVVAVNTFRDRVERGSGSADAITVKLYNDSRKARYTTPDRNMRDILMTQWAVDHLVNIPVNYNGNVITYYGGHGMLLTANFKPLVILSWQFERSMETDEEGTPLTKYSFIKPIIRIDPDCFSNSDPMMKWCVNKLFKTALTEGVYFSFGNTTNRHFNPVPSSIMRPSILIEKIPFNVRTPDVPDVLTTREEILQPVIDHIDELLQ